MARQSETDPNRANQWDLDEQEDITVVSCGEPTRPHHPEDAAMRVGAFAKTAQGPAEEVEGGGEPQGDAGGNCAAAPGGSLMPPRAASCAAHGSQVQPLDLGGSLEGSCIEGGESGYTDQAAMPATKLTRTQVCMDD